MKISRTVRWFSIIVPTLIFGFFVFNQFDLSEPVTFFTEKDLRPVIEQDLENGYFIILALLERAGVDPLSAGTTKKYREMIKQSIDRMTDRSEHLAPCLVSRLGLGSVSKRYARRLYLEARIAKE